MEPIKAIKTDAGRIESGFITERLDCTVRAYAAALNVPYPVAHSIFKQRGRKDGHKCFNTLQTWRAEGLTSEVPPEPVTLRRFIETHQTGVYMVRVRGHVTTLKDGIVYDVSTPRARAIVKDFVKVESKGGLQ